MLRPPIPEPNGAIYAAEHEEDRRAFKGAFWRIFLGATLYLELICLLIAAFFIVSLGRDGLILVGEADARRTAIEILVMALIGGLFWSLVSCLAVPLQTITVSRKGTNGYNFWALPLSYRWDEVASVKVWRLPLFPIIIVKLHDRYWRAWGTPIYADPAGFLAAVRELAPPDNPLRLFYEQEFGGKVRAIDDTVGG